MARRSLAAIRMEAEHVERRRPHYVNNEMRRQEHWRQTPECEASRDFSDAVRSVIKTSQAFLFGQSCLKMPLGEYLGRRDPEHLNRWLLAQWEGRRKAPKCGALTRAGEPCRRDRLRGADRCGHHIHGAERDKVDALRRQRLIRQLDGTRCVGLQRRLRRQLANIDRRNLHRLWKHDPLIEGSTLIVSSCEEDRLRAFLRDELNLNIDLADQVTGHFLTARSLDRSRWAAYLALAERCSHEAARRRVVGLLCAERKYWARRDAEGEPGP